jgi:Flp pilus assembly pilin Flp
MSDQPDFTASGSGDMNASNVPGAAMAYLRAMFAGHLRAMREAWRAKDRGASAVELAVITAIILGIAVVLLAVISHFVTTESNKIHP